MRRLLFPAFLLLLVALAIYAGSFYATRSVFAHYTHCDPASPWTAVPCNEVPGGFSRYYAGQRGNHAYPGGFSNGIEGFISAQDVSIHDTSQDFVADWVGVRSVAANEWVQAGFVEGILPNEYSRTTPKVYNEFVSACFGYSFAERSTPPPNPRYNEYFRVSWAGASGFACGQTVYIWQFGRGPSFATFDYGFMFVSSGRFRATTELRDKTHMEPIGTQCFGWITSCTTSGGYDLFLWKQSEGYWYQWQDQVPTIIDENQIVDGWASRYYHNDLQTWYEFTTTGSWQ
jgi:hypothetical protein